VLFFDGNFDYNLRRLDRVGLLDHDDEGVLTAEDYMKERTTTTYKFKNWVHVLDANVMAGRFHGGPDWFERNTV
jgi:hypothetical protein